MQFLNMQATKTLDPKDVKYIAVHCSATPADMNVDISDIDRWHRQRGFAKVGYHYVIKRDGTIQHGRSVAEHGVHMFEEGAQVEHFNACSIGVCLVGGLDKKGRPEDNFAPAQFDALASLLVQLKDWFPGVVIQGHRDFPHVQKDCPCFEVRSWLQDRKLN